MAATGTDNTDVAASASNSNSDNQKRTCRVCGPEVEHDAKNMATHDECYRHYRQRRRAEGEEKTAKKSARQLIRLYASLLGLCYDLEFTTEEVSEIRRIASPHIESVAHYFGTTEQLNSEQAACSVFTKEATPVRTRGRKAPQFATAANPSTPGLADTNGSALTKVG